MSTDDAGSTTDIDWPEPVYVDEEDLVWDEELGHHRCPLGLVQAARRIVACRERDSEGSELKLYLEQFEFEGLCDLVVVKENSDEVWLRAITCRHDRLRSDHARLIVEPHKKWVSSPLNGRRLFDAETGEEVWVHRVFQDRWTRGPRRDDVGDMSGLDIPF